MLGLSWLQWLRKGGWMERTLKKRELKLGVAFFLIMNTNRGEKKHYRNQIA